MSARRLEPEMRIPLIADAFLRAHEQRSEFASFRLAILGDGPELSSLRRRFNDPRIETPGYLETEDLHRLLLTCRAIVSIPTTDGTSASLLEAMAAGAIPIVNSLPANVQWVTPDLGVIVSRDPSPGELVDAMVAAATDSRPHATIRNAVADTAWEAQVDDLLSLYADLTGGSIGLSRHA